MAKLTVAELNKRYRKNALVTFIKNELQERSRTNEWWAGLPNCDESYNCLAKLNKTILIKIYECLMMLDK